MVAFVDDDESEGVECVYIIVFHGDALNGGDDDIASFDIEFVALYFADGAAIGESGSGAFDPLVEKEFFVDEDESFYVELADEIIGGDGFAEGWVGGEDAALSILEDAHGLLDGVDLVIAQFLGESEMDVDRFSASIWSGSIAGDAVVDGDMDFVFAFEEAGE